MSTPSSGLQSLYNSIAAGTTHPEPAGVPTESPQPSVPTGDSGLLSLYNSVTQPPSAPVSGGEPVQKTDNSLSPNAGVLDKAWHFLNTPLTEDFGAPESIHTGTGILGGIERGAYQIGTGFTSPLSLMLFVGTMGLGGFLESAGADVLKNTLMAGATGLDEAAATAKVAQFEKAAQAATDAMKMTGKPIAKAVQEASGMPYSEFQSLGNTLYDSGLTEKDLLNKGLTGRTISSGFRNLGMDAVKAQKVAKGTQWLMDTGFTAQQTYAALHTVPQVLDALADGRYDDAAQYATEGVVSGALGLIGGIHAYHSAGEAFNTLHPDEIERQRPSVENQLLNKILGKREGRHQEANQLTKNFTDVLRKDTGANTKFWNSVFETKDQKAAYRAKMDKMLMAMATGNDPELARQSGNVLADAIGQPERRVEAVPSQYPNYTFKPVDTSQPVSGRFYHGTKADINSVSELDPGSHGNEQALYGIGTYLTDNPKVAEGYAKTKGIGPQGKVLSANLNNANLLSLEQPVPENVHSIFERAIQGVNDDKENVPAQSDGKELFKKLQAAMEDQQYPRSEAQDVLSELTANLKQEGYDGLIHQGGKQNPHNVAIIFPDYGVGRPLSDIVKDAPSPDQTPHPGLPENIRELVANATISDKQKEHISRWINAYHAVAGGLTDGEKAVYDKLRAMDDRTWNIGNAMGLITSKIENHIHQIWGPKENAIGNELMQEARTGKLETSVNQARKRVWATYLDGLLRGREIVGDDPIAVVAHDYNTLYKAASNRAFIDTLRDRNVRGSDGRPLTVLSGLGHAVSGPNGENSAYLVNPNRVRNIQIADSVVNAMRKTGDLARFLNKGDILDLTPKVYPDNIDQFIKEFERQGLSQAPQYDAEGNNILRKNIEILKNVKNGNLPASALEEINAQQTPFYVWHPQDYVVPAHSSLQGWNWLAKTADGTNILTRADLKFHPESAQYLINRLGLDQSPLRDKSTLVGKVGSAVLTGGKEAKSVLLGGSPFHLMQIALRGVMTGTNPFRTDLEVELKNRPKLKRMVRQGLTLVGDKQALEDHSAGLAQHSKILGKIPVLGKAMDWYQDFLFNRYIPSMKADAAEQMFAKYQKAHPDWTEDAAAKAAAEHVNNVYGGINWRALGRATATQDWFHIMALAPDWLESEMRFAGSMLRGGLGDKNFSREQVLKMAAGLWGVARVLNYANTGNFHFEAPFGLATKDKDGRELIYSVRTLPTDILHMASDPVGFLKGRMSPFARLTEEAASGRNTFGKKLAPGDLAIDIARNMAPIPTQAIGQMASGDMSSVGNVGQIAKSAGITTHVYRTEAEKLTTQLASDHDDAGPMDPAKLRQYAAISRMEDGLRSGTVTPKDLQDARDFGSLSQDEYKKIQQNLKLTEGLDPELARMVSKVHRLPAIDALKIWDAATPKEKAALIKVMVKKKSSYIAKAMKSETPQQRLNDPIFRRLRLMFQEGEPVSENQFPPAIIPQRKYPITAINDQGHRIGSYDGQDWFDHETDEPISA